MMWQTSDLSLFLALLASAFYMFAVGQAWAKRLQSSDASSVESDSVSFSYRTVAPVLQNCVELLSHSCSGIDLYISMPAGQA